MCGIFGYLSYKNQLKNGKHLIRELAYFSTVRGMDATGFAYVDNGKMIIKKKGVNAYEFNYKVLPENPQVIIGHTRHLTRGKAEYNYNNHPFLIRARNGQFAFAHNGVIYNDVDLKLDFNLPKTKVQTDSYVVAQLLEQIGSVNLNTIREVSELVEGHLVFTFLDEQNNIYLVKGDNPLSIIHFPTIGLYVYASTEDILLNALDQFEQTYKLMENNEYEMIKVREGDILLIKNNGQIVRDSFIFNDPFASYYTGWKKFSNTTAIPAKYRKNTDYEMSALEKDYYKSIVQFAQTKGLTEEDIQLFINDGYTLDEIEEMLYMPDVLYDTLADIEFRKKMEIYF